MNTATVAQTTQTTQAAQISRAALPVSAQNRLSALALAGVMTLAMLLGVNGLATSDATPAQLAHHQVQQPA